MTDLNTKI